MQVRSLRHIALRELCKMADQKLTPENIDSLITCLSSDDLKEAFYHYLLSANELRRNRIKEIFRIHATLIPIKELRLPFAGLMGTVVRNVTLSPSGHYSIVAIEGNRSFFVLIDLFSRNPLYIEYSQQIVEDLHVSPDERYFAVGLGKQVVIYDLEKIVTHIRAETEQDDPSHTLNVHVVRSDGDTRILSSGSDNTRKLGTVVLHKVNCDNFVMNLLFSNDASSLFFSDGNIIRKIAMKDGLQSTFSTPASLIVSHIALHDQEKRLIAITTDGTFFIWDRASGRLIKTMDTDMSFGYAGGVYLDTHGMHFVFYDQDTHFVGDWESIWNDHPPATEILEQHEVTDSWHYGKRYSLERVPMAVNGALPYMVRVCYGNNNQDSLKLTLNYILDGSLESEVPLGNWQSATGWDPFDAGDMKKIAISRDGTLVFFANDCTGKCHIFEIKDAQIPLLALLFMVYFDQQKAPLKLSMDSLEHKLLIQLEEPVRNSLIRFFSITLV